jgi:hypothetical protein
MTTSTGHRRTALAFTALLSLGTIGAACGDDGGSSGGTTTVAPEDVKVPLEEVIAGLPAISAGGAAAAEAAAEGDFEGALAAYDALHEDWEGIEGTLKDTDPDAYETIETAQGLMRDGAENGIAERVADGAADQAAAIDGFIADHG